MTRPVVDARIRRWLDAGATRAPDELVETVLAEFPSVPQRRGFRALLRWRPPRVRVEPLGVALIGVLLVGGAVGWVVHDQASHGAAPSSAPTSSASGNTASPSASAMPTVPGSPFAFASRAFGYRLAIPSDWLVLPGAGGWRSAIPTTSNTFGLDEFEGPRGLVLIGSRPVAATTTIGSWTASVIADSHRLGAYHWATPQRMTLGGAPADLVVVTCDQCAEYYLLITSVHAGSGWYLYWASDTVDQVGRDRQTFLDLLRTFAFTK